MCYAKKSIVISDRKIARKWEKEEEKSKWSIKCDWDGNFVLVQMYGNITYPQDAVACNGVHPSLSCLFTSAPCCTKNSTISKLSSMHAYLRRKTKYTEII